MTKPSAAAQQRARDYAEALKRNAERVNRDIRASQDALDKHRREQLGKRKR